MNAREGLIETIGNTPLIKLNRLAEMTGCTIFGKAEFLNYGGSVKDRAARYIIPETGSPTAIGALLTAALSPEVSSGL